MSPPSTPLPALHRRRLREIWRSAGWPCRDTVEVELLAAGLIERRFDAEGRETLLVTAPGIQVLAATLARNRAAFDAHEALVARVAEQMQRDGRIVWCGLTLRAPLPALPQEPAPTQSGLAEADAAPATQSAHPAHAAHSAHAAPQGPADAELAHALSAAAAVSPARLRWVMAMPDVYSIRHTTVEAFTEPAVHEIKVRRADLLADLRRPDKGAAYRALCSQCWYVLGPGVGTADDVPPEYGVLLAGEGGLELARPAPRRAMTLDFAVWMALARANALPPADEAAQSPLRPHLPSNDEPRP